MSRVPPTVADGRGGNFGGVITGAFLAEAASVVDNKLAASGGVFSGFRVGSARVAEFVLVVLTQAETDNPVRVMAATSIPAAAPA
jgi:hypothetical protein